MRRRHLLVGIVIVTLLLAAWPARASSVVERRWDTSFSLRIPSTAPAGERWWATVDGAVGLRAPAGWVICEWRIESSTFGGTDHWTYHYRADGSYIVRFGFSPFDENTPGTTVYNTTFEPAPIMAWTVAAPGGREELYWVDYVVVYQTDCGMDRSKEIWYFRKPTAWGGTTAGPANPEVSLEPGQATQPTQAVDWVREIYEYLTNPPPPPSPPPVPAWQPYQPPAPVTMVPTPRLTPRQEAPVQVPSVRTLPVPPPVPPPPPLPPLPPVVDRPFGDEVDPIRPADPPVTAEPAPAPDPVVEADPVLPPDPVQMPDPVVPPDRMEPDPVMPPDPVVAPDPVAAPDPVQAPDAAMAADPPPPGQPQGVVAVAGPGSCALSWQPVDRATEYRIYRDFGEEPVATVKNTSWMDANLFAGHQYYYQVSAVDVRGNEGARSWVVYCAPL